MPKEPMSTFVAGGKEFEVVDKVAREKINCVTYKNIAEMRANFTHDIGICYVIKDDSTYCQGFKGNYYEFTNNSSETFAEEPLTNGGYGKLVIPEFNPHSFNDRSEILPTLLDIAYSYCGVYKEDGFTLSDSSIVHNVQYQSENGPFMTESSKHNGIQCSQFVNCMLYGLPYEQSKLADEDNNNYFITGGCRNIKINGSYAFLSANELAHYAACHGWLKETHNLRECEIGDVIFFQDLSSTYTSVDWKGIVHVGIIVGKFGESVLFAQSGGAPTMSGISQRVVRVGNTTDAVNFVSVEPVDYRDWHNGTVGLYGFARFPLRYKSKKPLNSDYYSSLNGTYNASHGSNIAADIIRESDNKNAKFGVLSCSGYGELKNSGTGVFITIGTKGTSYDSPGGTQCDSTPLNFNGCYAPLLFKKDGASKLISLIMAIRCSEASNADTYSINDIHVDLYA